MMKLPCLPLTAALLVLGELTYVLCLAAGAVWPQAIDMRGLFRTLLPGFGGFDVLSVLIGSGWIAVYAVYAATVASLTWNFVVGRLTGSPR
jgi:hypothetical protein